MTTLAQRKYDISQSPFYKLSNKKKLAELLKLQSSAALTKLLYLETPYRKFEVENKKTTKFRKVQMPSRELFPVHVRIFKLLRRIKLPDYLHSGASGRSYITNAKSHCGTKKTYTLDIKAFYPSVSRLKVYDFFCGTMECSTDIANILSKISTCDGYIPTGSSLSQLLAFLACKKMFDELYTASSEAGVVMTCYVDDLSFSGDLVTRKWINDTIKPIIFKYGLKSHKDKFFGPGRPKEITGVIIDGDQIKLCNRHHKAIYDLQLKIPTVDSIDKINKLYDELVGRLSSASQIDNKFRYKKQIVIRKRKSVTEIKYDQSGAKNACRGSGRENAQE